MSDSNFVDPILKITETPKAKPTVRVRINRNRKSDPIKDLSDQINALQRSVAYVISRLSKLDEISSIQRESGW
jgi:hypothetical protein